MRDVNGMKTRIAVNDTYSFPFRLNPTRGGARLSRRCIRCRRVRCRRLRCRRVRRRRVRLGTKRRRLRRD